jgi:hypothetical protein
MVFSASSIQHLIGGCNGLARTVSLGRLPRWRTSRREEIYPVGPDFLIGAFLLTTRAAKPTLNPFYSSPSLHMANAATAAKPPSVSNKPIVKRQLGNISVAVFVRDVSTPDGSTFSAKSFVLQK